MKKRAEPLDITEGKVSMLRRTFRAVETFGHILFLMGLGYAIPFLTMRIIDSTLGLTIYTFCLGYLCLLVIIIIFSICGNHIKRRRIM